MNAVRHANVHQTIWGFCGTWRQQRPCWPLPASQTTRGADIWAMKFHFCYKLAYKRTKINYFVLSELNFSLWTITREKCDRAIYCWVSLIAFVDCGHGANVIKSVYPMSWISSTIRLAPLASLISELECWKILFWRMECYFWTQISNQFSNFPQNKHFPASEWPRIQSTKENCTIFVWVLCVWRTNSQTIRALWNKIKSSKNAIDFCQRSLLPQCNKNIILNAMQSSRWPQRLLWETETCRRN